MASTRTAPLVKLRSPFSLGQDYVVPPEASPVFVDALIKAGFTRVEEKDEPECLDLPAAPNKKSK